MTTQPSTYTCTPVCAAVVCTNFCQVSDLRVRVCGCDVRVCYVHSEPWLHEHNNNKNRDPQWLRMMRSLVGKSTGTIRIDFFFFLGQCADVDLWMCDVSGREALGYC